MGGCGSKSAAAEPVAGLPAAPEDGGIRVSRPSTAPALEGNNESSRGHLGGGISFGGTVRHGLHRGMSSFVHRMQGQKINVTDVLEQAHNAHRDGKFKRAVKYYKKALHYREVEFKDPMHPEVAKVLLSLATTYLKMENSPEARAASDRALLIRETRLGETHMETAEAMMLKAEACMLMGQHDQSVKLGDEALAIRKKELGGEHLGTATCMAQVAWFYAKSGEHADAMEMIVTAKRIRETLLKNDKDPLIGDMYHDIGELHMEAGNYSEAEENFADAISIRKTDGMSIPLLESQLLLAKAKAMGKKTTEALALYIELINSAQRPELVARCHEGVADVYKARNDTEEAFRSMEKACKSVAAAFGADSAQTASMLVKTALLLSDSSSNNTDIRKRRLVLLKKAYKIQSHMLGPGHPSTVHTQLKLGEALDAAGHSDKALAFYQTIAEANDDDGSMASLHNRADALQNMGRIYFIRKDYERASNVYAKALPLYRQTSKSDGEDVAKLLYNLGQAKRRAGYVDEAKGYLKVSLKLYSVAVKASESDQGVGTISFDTTSFAEPSTTATVAYQYGTLLLEEGVPSEMDAAANALKMAADIRVKSQSDGAKTELIVRATHAAGRALIKADRKEEALEYMKVAAEGLTDLRGQIHEEVAAVKTQIAETYMDLGQFDMAISTYEDVAEIRQNVKSDKPKEQIRRNANLANTYYNLAVLHEQQGNQEKSAQYFNVASSLRRTSMDMGGNKEIAWEAALHSGISAAQVGNNETAAAELGTLLHEQVESEGEHGKAVIETCMALGSVYVDLGHYQQAMDTFKQALASCERNEVDEEQKQRSLYNAAVAATLAKNYDEALIYSERSLQTQKNVDPTGEKVGDIIYQIGNILKDQGNTLEAANKYKETVEIWKPIKGAKSEDVSHILYDMGHMYESLEMYDDAVGVFFQCEIAWEELKGLDSEDVAVVSNDIATVLQKQKEFGDAIGWYEKTHGIYKKIYGPHHEKTELVMEQLELMKWKAED